MKESARAIAQASQVTGIGGWLPLGVRAGAFTYNPPTQLTITPGDGSHNVGGMINTPAGPDCKFYGGNQIADVIKGNGLRRGRCLPDRDRPDRADADRREQRQHHQQGL